MALTVGTEGVVVFTADYRPFKTYQLRSLMGWSSEGVGQSEDPQMHTRLKLKKRHGGVGSTVEFAMQPGDPKAVALALTDVARELAAEAQRRGSEVTSLTPRKWGWAHKRPSAYRQTGTAPTAEQAKLQWNRRYFVLFAGKGIDAGKLLYFDTDASYTSQLAEHKSTGAPFNPKGAIELAGAKAQRTREECEVGWATFAVSTALRTLYLKVQEAEVDGWLQACAAAAVNKERAALDAEQAMQRLWDDDDDEEEAESAVEPEMRAWLEGKGAADLTAAVSASLTAAGHEVDEWLDVLGSFAPADLDSFLDLVRQHYTTGGEKKQSPQSASAAGGGGEPNLLATTNIFGPVAESHPEFLAELALELTPRRAAVGEIIASKDEVGDEMYFIAAGCVEVLVSLDRPPVASLSAGAAFGESALLSNEPRNAFVVGARDPDAAAAAATAQDEGVELLVLSAAGLREVLARHPGVEAALEEDAWLWQVQAKLDFFAMEQ